MLWENAKDFDYFRRLFWKWKFYYFDLFFCNGIASIFMICFKHFLFLAFCLFFYLFECLLILLVDSCFGEKILFFLTKHFEIKKRKTLFELTKIFWFFVVSFQYGAKVISDTSFAYCFISSFFHMFKLIWLQKLFPFIFISLALFTFCKCSWDDECTINNKVFNFIRVIDSIFMICLGLFW